MVGKTVSHYRVIRELGRGGMGVVYEAEDLNLPRRVALKFCSAAQDSQLRTALLNEAQALCSLIHPNIAEVYELGQTEEGQPFIAMELLPGALDGELRQRRLGVRESVRTVAAVAKALEYAHSRGVVHRDIKPSNVRMTEAGQVKVTDFGIAGTLLQAAAAATVPTSERRTVTIEQVRRGTPGFMAPEIIQGYRADRRSDLFALGCVLYQCLTGKHPFRGATVEEKEDNVLRLDPPRPSSVEPVVWPRLDAVTLKLLEKKPEDRYQSAGEVVAALEAVDEPLPVVRPAVKYRRQVFAYLAAVAALLIGVVVLLNFILQPSIPPEAMKAYRNGLEELEDGTYFNAAKRFQQAITLYPDFTMAHAHLAEAWDELDFADEAKKEMLKAVPGRRIKADDSLHLDAIRATVTGDLSKAASLFKQLADRVSGPDRAEALLDLGRVYDRAEKRKEAADAYSAAAKADSQSGAPFLRLGTVHVTLREPDKAAAALTTAEARYRTASNTEGLTECLYARARLENKPAESLRILDEALNRAKFDKNEQQQIKILLLMSNKHVEMGSAEKAIEAADAALSLARMSRLENMATRGLVVAGVAIWQRGGNTERPRQYLETALAIAQGSGSKRSEAMAKANLGSLLITLGDRDKGEALARDALAFYKAGGYRSETARMLMLVAQVEQDRGSYDAAMQDCMEAIDTIDKTKPSRTLAQAQDRLAGLFENKEDFAAAREWYGKSLQTADALGFGDMVASVTAALAQIAAWLGHDSEARAYLQQGESSTAGLSGEPTEYLPRAEGVVALAAGRYGAAISAFEAALQPGRLNDADVKCSVTTWLGLALLRSGRLADGGAVCSRAMRMAEDLADPELQAAASLAMAEHIIALGRPAEAVPVLRKTLPYLEQVGKRESFWRALALLARAEADDQAKRAATRARDVYNQLTATWDASDAHSYSSRSDIHRLLVTIDRIERGKNH
jgi:serine/threonine protein kinase